MTRTIRRAIRAGVLTLAALAFTLSGASTAFADDEPDRDYWVQRYESLRNEVDDLRARFDTLETQYRKSRQRNYPRGEARAKLKAERESVKEELALKEQELEDFPDEARRAGALPGWFRD